MFNFQRLIGALALTGLGVTAGCGGTSDQAPRSEPHDILLRPDARSIDARVPANATLETLLRQHELSAETTGSLMKAVAGVFNPKQLRANQEYRLTRTLDGLFREFRYKIDADRLLRVFARPGAQASALSAEVITLPKEIKLDAITGEIGKGQSLIGVLEAAGENIQVALEMARIFGGEVDFNSDLQPGDRFEVLVERVIRNGEFAGYGDVKAAVLVNEGRRLTAIERPDSDGKPTWYDVEGRSLIRQFLKTPLPFDPRITSRFSTRRFHPVHGIFRPHLGVDYGAPYGTRVLAAADGVIESAAWAGEAGRMIKIRHTSGYETAYLHLSSFAPDIRPGVRVKQGQDIGRVGATGTATGPHLDYRIIRNGRYVDPIAELRRMPKGEPLAASQLASFYSLRDEVMGQLSTILASANHRPESAAPRK